MQTTYSVTQAQSKLPQILRETAKDNVIRITRHDETVAYVLSPERMEAILETLEILGNPAAMKAIQAHRTGKGRYYSLDELDRLIED